MSNNIEIEAKVLLSHREYLKVVESLEFKPEDQFTQTNHYIDSKERDLKANGIALRIREKSDEIVLTLKTPLAEGLLEKNQTLTKEESDKMINENVFPKGPIADFLEILDVNVDSLQVLATLVTNRYEKPFKTGKVALDENLYSDMVDYELEMEESAIMNARALIKEILDPLNIHHDYKLEQLTLFAVDKK